MTRTRTAAMLAAFAAALGLATATRTDAQQQQAKAESARVKAILTERAVTLKGIADRLAVLATANPPQAGPQDVFQAKTAAGLAEAEAADTDPARRAVLERLLAETIAYEKVVADSVRANPAPANDARGRVERENAVAQMRLSRLDLELAIERLK